MSPDKRRYETLQQYLIVAVCILAMDSLMQSACICAEGGDMRDTPMRVLVHPKSLFVLHNTEVQQDLALSPGQIKAISECMEECISLSAERLATSRELVAHSQMREGSARESVRLRLAEIAESLNKISDDFEHRSREVLLEKQVTRLDQTHLWLRGASILQDRAVQEYLGICEAQASCIQELSHDCFRESQQIFQDLKQGLISADSAVARAKALREAMADRAFRTLTDEQRIRLCELRGPKPPYDPAELVFRVTTPPTSPIPRGVQDQKGCEERPGTE